MQQMHLTCAKQEMTGCTYPPPRNGGQISPASMEDAFGDATSAVSQSHTHARA